MKRLLCALFLSVCWGILNGCEDTPNNEVPQTEPLAEVTFKMMALGKGWQCVESHETDATGTWFEKGNYYSQWIGSSPTHFYLEKDSATLYFHSDAHGKYVFSHKPLLYHHNNFYLGNTRLKILRMTDREMHVLAYSRHDAQEKTSPVYSIYRAMSPETLAQYQRYHTTNADSLQGNWILYH